MTTTEIINKCLSEYFEFFKWSMSESGIRGKWCASGSSYPFNWSVRHCTTFFSTNSQQGINVRPTRVKKQHENRKREHFWFWWANVRISSECEFEEKKIEISSVRKWTKIDFCLLTKVKEFMLKTEEIVTHKSSEQNTISSANRMNVFVFYQHSHTKWIMQVLQTDIIHSIHQTFDALFIFFFYFSLFWDIFWDWFLKNKFTI